MDRERISVDDLLARQSTLRPGIRATIKADVDDRVTVTPFVAGSTCGCAHKITVHKADIEYVTPTDDVGECCGEKLTVVEVAFANETVASIFRQLSEAAAESLKHRTDRMFRPDRMFSPWRTAPPRPWPTPRGWYDWSECCWICERSPGGPEDLQRCYDRCRLLQLEA